MPVVFFIISFVPSKLTIDKATLAVALTVLYLAFIHGSIFKYDRASALHCLSSDEPLADVFASVC